MNAHVLEIQDLINLLSSGVGSVEFQEMIWWVYVRFLSDGHNEPSEYGEMKPLLSSLSRKRSIRLLHIIRQLCEHEKRGLLYRCSVRCKTDSRNSEMK